MYRIATYWADLNGRRNSLFSASLIDGLERFVQRLGRSFPAEGFAGSCVQGKGDGRQGGGVKASRIIVRNAVDLRLRP